MKLFYKSHGASEPLILIPGFASGAWTWFCQEKLSKDFQLITFDPRGIGESKNEDLTNLSMKEFVEDIRWILDDSKIEKANVLGASFGGFVAQEFALRFPERLKKLVLACTSAGGTSHVMPDFDILQTFVPNQNLTVGERIRNSIRPAFTGNFPAAEFERVCRMREESEVAEAVYNAQMQTALSFDTSEQLGAIENETLVITGDKDFVVPMQNSVNLAEKLPNATLKIIENGSHMFFIENAEEFNEIVSQFVSRP